MLAGGSAGGQFVVVRLRPSGSLDSRFGTGGQVVPALPGTSLDGVRALATFRDGRIVAAGTLRLADGTTRMVAIRLLPTGEIDPSFGAGFGYVLAGPVGAELGAMTMDRNGNVILAGSRPNGAGAEMPIVIRLLPDGTPDPRFGAGGTFDGASLGSAAAAPRACWCARRARSPSPSAGPTGGATRRRSPPSACCPPARPTRRSAAPGSSRSRSAPAPGRGVGAQAIAPRPGRHDARRRHRPDRRPGRRAARSSGCARTARSTRASAPRGVTRISRAGDEIRITAMVRDSQGRILLVGLRAPARTRSWCACAPTARATTRFGNGGLTFPLLGRPPGGEPDLHDLRRDRRRWARARSSPARPRARACSGAPGTGTIYTGRFALTVSKLQ